MTGVALSYFLHSADILIDSHTIHIADHIVHYLDQRHSLETNIPKLWQIKGGATDKLAKTEK